MSGRKSDAVTRFWMPRPLHPMAWWAWAIGAAVAVSAGTNPLLIICIVMAVTTVVMARRGDNPWARSFRVYVYIAIFVVVMRVAYRVIFGGGDGPTVLFQLPYIPLPYWVGGIRLLGPVSLEAVLTGLYDGLRLGAMIVCLGAANALANPKRLIACLPGAFYEIGTVMVVAIGVFPQLGDSTQRVMKARKLRPMTEKQGRFSKYHMIRSIIVPVLSDALDRCLMLAASMDARGYGRAGSVSRTHRKLTTVLILTALVLIGVGSYGVMAPVLAEPWQQLVVGKLALLAGVGLGGLGLWLAGSKVKTTTYRPDRWRLAEILTCLSPLAAWLIIGQIRRSDDARFLNTATNPAEWPILTVTMLIVVVLVALPAVLTPPPRLTTTPVPGSEVGVS